MNKIPIILPQEIVDEITRYCYANYNQYKRTRVRNRYRTFRSVAKYIKDAISISKYSLDNFSPRIPSIQEWVENGWQEIFLGKWYYAIVVVTREDGEKVAMVQKAQFNAEHTDSVPQDNGYIPDIINEEKTNRIITESINRYLAENCMNTKIKKCI